MFSAFQTFGKLGAMASSVARAWSPLALWPNGIASPGMWIDPSLLTASFNDYTGTTPVATPGSVADSANPVGLMLDRHNANTPTIYTDYTVAPASWTFLGASYNSGTFFLKEDASNGWHLSYPTKGITSGNRGVLIAEVKPSTRTWALLNLGGFVYFDLSSGAPGIATNCAGYGIKPLADGWFEISIAPFITAANGWVANASGDGVGNYLGDNVSGIYARNVRQNLFRHGKTTFNASPGASASTITRTPTPKYRGGLLMGDSFAVSSTTDATKTVNNTSTNLMMSPVGTGGRTLTQINAAFTTDVGAFDPSFAVLHGGINDINLAGADPVATMQAQVAAFIANCAAVDIFPVLTKLPPDKDYSAWSATRQGWMDTYNAWITTYAATARLPLIDLPAILSTDGQTLSAGYNSGDGLHPNAAGYAAIGAAIVTALDSVVLSGNHMLQASTTARPLESAYDGQTLGPGNTYDATGYPIFQLYDGVDDGMATASFAAGTLINGMDYMIAVRRDSAAACVAGLYNGIADATKFFGMAESASGSGCVGSGAGTPTVWVDGVQLSGGTAVTRGTLHTALTVGDWHILEFRGLDLSTWTAAGFGLYTSYLFNGPRGDIMLFPSTASTEDKDAARQWLADYYGVTLP